MLLRSKYWSTTGTVKFLEIYHSDKNPFYDGLIISNHRNSHHYAILTKQMFLYMTRQTMRKVINYSVCYIIWISFWHNYRLSYTMEMPISFWWVWFSHICDCLMIQISQTWPEYSVDIKLLIGYVLIRPRGLKYSQNKQIYWDFQPFIAVEDNWQTSQVMYWICLVSVFCVFFLHISDRQLDLSVGSEDEWIFLDRAARSLLRHFLGHSHTPSTYGDDEDVITLDIERFLTRQVRRPTHKEKVGWGTD